MTEPWVLAIDAASPGGNPAARLGGLTLALRLALDAQAGGAAAVVCAAELRPLLADARLRLPLVSEAPAGSRVVSVPASTLVHRDYFKAGYAAGQSPYGFEPIDVVSPET